MTEETKEPTPAVGKAPGVQRPLKSLRELEAVFQGLFKSLNEQGFYTEEISMLGKMLTNTADIETYNNVQVRQFVSYQQLLSQTEEGRKFLQQQKETFEKTQVVKPMSQQDLDEARRARMKHIKQSEDKVVAERMQKAKDSTAG